MNDRIGSTEWRKDQALRQEMLNASLRKFCEREITSTVELEKIAEDLNYVYADAGFRHRYSDLLDVIYDIDDDVPGLDSPGEEAQYVIARSSGLAQGLRQLYIHRCSKMACGGEEVCQIRKLQMDRRLGKLYDHANLEARRIGYETGPTRGQLPVVRPHVQNPIVETCKNSLHSLSRRQTPSCYAGKARSRFG